jgi:glycerol-3-phosphate O-acyltransferase
MLREARGLARFVKAGLLAESAIRSAIAGAAEQAGKSVDEADAVITWALDHPSAATLPAGVN